MAHPLSGADLGTLRRVFAGAGGGLKAGATAAIWGAALARAPFSALERALVRLPELDDLPPPVFILGHWRSGTTHLYNCMSFGRFGWVPPVAVGMPHDMFGLARMVRPLLERALPEHRYIDNIPVTPTSPQEDEIALASMCDVSFYHGLYFPRRFDEHLGRGLWFEGCSEREVARWERAFTTFLRRVAKHHGPEKPLLIKNPVYTGRVAMLRRIFPRAKFIHIHRNPFDVFLSMRNFYARLLDVMALQDVPALDIDGTILSVYDRMMERFVDDTRDLAAPDFVELGYETLDRDPMGALETIYGTLELGGWEEAAPAFRAYLASVKSYAKNTFRGDAAAVDAVRGAWGRWLDRWGYEAPVLPPSPASEPASRPASPASSPAASPEPGAAA